MHKEKLHWLRQSAHITGDGNQKADGVFQESSTPKIGNTRESVSLLKAADSSDPCDVSMDTEHNNDNREADSASPSKKSKSNNAFEKSEEDDHPKTEEDDNSDSDESDTDLKVSSTCFLYLMVPVGLYNILYRQ